MSKSKLELSRARILAYRQRVGALDGRLPPGRSSVRRAGLAGFQDSMPRAALLSIHARVEGTEPTTLDDPYLVQLWGPRFNVYVVDKRDRAAFSLGRLAVDPAGREKAEGLANRLASLLAGDEMPFGKAGRALGVHPNQLRYAAPTGTVLLRWDGANQPVVRSVPPPDIDPGDARKALARRYLHVYGPATPEGFTRWAGIGNKQCATTFEALGTALIPVRVPTGVAWILAEDESEMLADPGPSAHVRLLPSGDAYYLCWGDDRKLLVTRLARRDELWTSRVWPGAVLVEGDIVGTWRRSEHKVAIQPWRRLSRRQRDAIEAEVLALPLPGIERPLDIRFEEVAG